MPFVLNRGVPEFCVGLFPQATTYHFDLPALVADLKEIEPLAGVFEKGYQLNFKQLKRVYGRCHTRTKRIELSPATIRNPANLMHTTIHELCHLDPASRPRSEGGRTPWHGPLFYRLLARSLDALYSMKIEQTTMFSATYAVRSWKMYEFDEYAIAHPRERDLSDLYLTEVPRSVTPLTDALRNGASVEAFVKSFR